MSAVVQTGSREARSACGTKLIVVFSSARTMLGAANTAAPARADFRTSRRFIVISPLDPLPNHGARNRLLSGNGAICNRILLGRRAARGMLSYEVSVRP